MTFYSLRSAWCSHQKQFIFYSFSGAVLLCWMINWYMFILLNQVPSAMSPQLFCMFVFFFSQWLIWKIELISPLPPSCRRLLFQLRRDLSCLQKELSFSFFILSQKSINPSPRASSSHINKTIKSNGYEAILCFVCFSLCKATTWGMLVKISVTKWVSYYYKKAPHRFEFKQWVNKFFTDVLRLLLIYREEN